MVVWARWNSFSFSSSRTDMLRGQAPLVWQKVFLREIVYYHALSWPHSFQYVNQAFQPQIHFQESSFQVMKAAHSRRFRYATSRARKLKCRAKDRYSIYKERPGLYLAHRYIVRTVQYDFRLKWLTISAMITGRDIRRLSGQ